MHTGKIRLKQTGKIYCLYWYGFVGIIGIGFVLVAYASNETWIYLDYAPQTTGY